MTSNTINYEPVNINYPTSATNHYVTNQGGSVTGVSNSGKSFRDGTPSINTNYSNRNCKYTLSH